MAEFDINVVKENLNINGAIYVELSNKVYLFNPNKNLFFKSKLYWGDKEVGPVHAKKKILQKSILKN